MNLEPMSGQLSLTAAEIICLLVAVFVRHVMEWIQKYLRVNI